MNTPKKQHYVPQAYLARFANDQLNVCDMQTGRVFACSPRDTGHENGFYTYPPETTLDDGESILDLNEVEAVLQKFDSEQAKRIANVLSDVVVSPSLSLARSLRWLGLPLLIQFNRTKRMRELLFDLLNKSGQDLVNQICEKNFPEVAPDRRPRFSYLRNALPVMHANYLLDSKRNRRFIRDLLPQIWILARSCNDIPFITSDQPVVRAATLCENRRELSGFGDRGASVIWPLSPAYALVIKDRDFFEEEAGQDGLVHQMLPAEVESLNRLQVENCHRFVYSSSANVNAIQMWRDSEHCRYIRAREKVFVTHEWTGNLKSRTEVRVNI